MRGPDFFVEVAQVSKQPARPKRKLSDLPGPRGWPLLGNALDLEPKRFHAILEGWAETYGPTFTYRFGRRTVLVVTEARAIEAILRARPTTFRRFRNLEAIFKDLGISGVFSAEGSEWRAQRRLAMEALSQRHLQSFYPTLVRVADRLRARWSAAASAPALASASASTSASPRTLTSISASTSNPTAASLPSIDLQDDLMRFTVDVTTSLAFSMDANTLEQGPDVIQNQLHHIFPAISRRLVTPIPYWRYFKLPADRQLDAALVEVRRFLNLVIEQARHRVALKGESASPADFLEAMILARDEEGQPFSDEVMFGNTLTMLLAGEDTTANTLAWLVHGVCERPDLVARMREEIDREMGDEQVPGLATLKRLTFVDAVAQETMRLSPVAPLLLHEPLHDTEIDGIEVPKDTIVATLLRAPSLRTDHLTDPRTFDPGRWLVPGESVSSLVFPFGSGPRICPGRSLAMLEIYLVTAMLFRNFDVVRVGEKEDVRERFAFTMMPDGLKVRLTPRSP